MRHFFVSDFDSYTFNKPVFTVNADTNLIPRNTFDAPLLHVRLGCASGMICYNMATVRKGTVTTD